MSDKIISKLGCFTSASVTLLAVVLYLASRNDSNTQADILRQIASTPSTGEVDPGSVDELAHIVEETPEILMNIPSPAQALRLVASGEIAVAPEMSKDIVGVSALLLKSAIDSCPLPQCFDNQRMTDENYRTMASVILEEASSSGVSFAEIATILIGYGGNVNDFNVQRLLFDKKLYWSSDAAAFVGPDEIFPGSPDNSDLRDVVRYIIANLDIVFEQNINNWNTPPEDFSQWFGGLGNFSAKYLPNDIYRSDDDIFRDKNESDKAVVMSMMRVEGMLNAMDPSYGEDKPSYFIGYENLNDKARARRDWIIDTFIRAGGGIPRKDAMKIRENINVAVRTGDAELRALYNHINKPGRPEYDVRALQRKIQIAERRARY